VTLYDSTHNRTSPIAVELKSCTYGPTASTNMLSADSIQLPNNMKWNIATLKTYGTLSPNYDPISWAVFIYENDNSYYPNKVVYNNTFPHHEVWPRNPQGDDGPMFNISTTLKTPSAVVPVNRNK
jgi:hypothetical protein